MFIVCGGFKVSLSDATEFQSIVENMRVANRQVLCHDGELFQVPETVIVDGKRNP